MLDSWNQSIFCDIKQRLQDAAMKLVHAERNGEAFDSQLVIGVRESYGEPPLFLISIYYTKS
jgi:cullin-5